MRADEDVPFGAFATVMDAVKQAGISNVSIVTQPIIPMAANAEIFFEHANWSRPLALSVGFHAAVVGFIILYAVFVHSTPGEGWGGGGGGDAMSATLVSTVPLPASQVQTDNVLANESKGLTKSLPQVPDILVPDAIPIPDKATKPKKNKPETSASKQKAAPPVEESNVIPSWPGRSGQRSLWHVQRWRRQGWVRILRRRRRFRQPLLVVCEGRSAEGLGKLAEVRN